MTGWTENLDKVKSGSATKVEFVDAVTHWLGTSIAENTEGMHEAVSRRVIWVFPDNYVLAVGTNFDPTFYHLSKELTKDDVIPLPQTLQKEWVFSTQSNGWTNSGFSSSFPTAEQILGLIDLFTSKHGEPKIVLPWGYSWTVSVVDEDEDYYSWYVDEIAEGEENIRETMFHLATALGEGKLAKASPWEFVATDDEEEGLSYYSDFAKFKRFIERVSEEKLAILDLDQHCASCSSGTYEYAVKEDPELEGKEIFRTWGQNSENMWLGDGSILVDAFMNDESVEKQLKIVAEEEGLDMGLDDEEWSASGSFYYES